MQPLGRRTTQGATGRTSPATPRFSPPSGRSQTIAASSCLEAAKTASHPTRRAGTSMRTASRIRVRISGTPSMTEASSWDRPTRSIASFTRVAESIQMAPSGHRPTPTTPNAAAVSPTAAHRA